MAEKKMNFEEALDKLENIVADLESGKLPLEDCLKTFEDGLKIYKNCKSILASTEKKIVTLADSLKDESV